jgi:hypothetical protein
MREKLGIGALVATLLVSGLLVGVSHGDPPPVAGPQVIELSSGKVLAERSRGISSQIREEALDVDGARIGTIRWNCADGTDWHCTVVYGLKGSPDTRGTVVAMGIFRGFDGESLAVVGGTGAFAGAGGAVTLETSGDAFTHTLDLIA